MATNGYEIQESPQRYADPDPLIPEITSGTFGQAAD
jgi:hypothetical protein